LPHLDYNLQRLGPTHPSVQNDLKSIDAIVGELIEFFQKRSIRVMVLSEYGITPVNQPIHLNRLFRKQGWLAIKEELRLELLDCGASRAFAVADHQVAHIYVNDPGIVKTVRKVLEGQAGISGIFDREQQKTIGLDHPRSGDLVVFSEEQAWFTYYYWMDDALAPDFARCVDIHRKPGYDPVELFLDPGLKAPKLKIAWRLLQKKIGMRMLMDVIPLDATLVKGSHGTRPRDAAYFPVVLSDQKGLLPGGTMRPTEIYNLIKRHVSG
jgi:predicted AlkP superfamily pyrophosphatase or phosphodiesterase